MSGSVTIIICTLQVYAHRFNCIPLTSRRHLLESRQHFVETLGNGMSSGAHSTGCTQRGRPMFGEVIKAGVKGVRITAHPFTNIPVLSALNKCRLLSIKK